MRDHFKWSLQVVEIELLSVACRNKKSITISTLPSAPVHIQVWCWNEETLLYTLPLQNTSVCPIQQASRHGMSAVSDALQAVTQGWLTPRGSRYRISMNQRQFSHSSRSVYKCAHTHQAVPLNCSLCCHFPITCSKCFLVSFLYPLYARERQNFPKH